MQGTIITNLPGRHGGPVLAYDGPWPPPDEQVGKAAPAPAGASTPPPEGAHKTEERRVTSLAPSGELADNQPAPYGITATAQSDTLYSPDVNYRGTAAMHVRWEAAMWLYASIGDALRTGRDLAGAKDALFNAMNCPDGHANPFVLLRLGQTLADLGDVDGGVEHLMRAYMLEGEDVFEGDAPYLKLLRDRKLID